jgi:hypothetical protein
MLTKPVLALCDNRAQLARTNPTYGEPDQWMTSAHLAPLGLSTISFDFFIDWGVKPPIVGDEMWVKRLAHVPVTSLRKEDVLQGALACEDDLLALQAFATRYGFNARYMIFRDNVDWLNAPEPLLIANLADTFTTGCVRDLGQVMDAIRRFSGGALRIGEKGLIYGTSSLECHLSRTNALWPGDADCVIWSMAEYRALALLEFKKHNGNTPLAEENIQQYMSKDRRKWKRLGLLRDRIEAPLFCVYYSTNPREDYIKVERLDGAFDALEDGGSRMISIAGMSQIDIGLTIANAVSE